MQIRIVWKRKFKMIIFFANFCCTFYEEKKRLYSPAFFWIYRQKEMLIDVQTGRQKREKGERQTDTWRERQTKVEQADILTNRETNSWTDVQKDNRTNNQTDKQIDKHRDKQTDNQTDKHRDKQTDRHRDKQTDKQTDVEINK